jgi:hypothetical protein
MMSVKGSEGNTYAYNEIKGRITNTGDFPVTVDGGCTRFDNRVEQMSYVPIGGTGGIISAKRSIFLFTVDIPLSQLSDNNALITCSIQNVFIQYPTPIPSPWPTLSPDKINLVNPACTKWEFPITNAFL